jgi:predicted amidohydrolase
MKVEERSVTLYAFCMLLLHPVADADSIQAEQSCLGFFICVSAMPANTTTVRLAAIQFTPVFGNKRENFQRIKALIENIRADIYIFPELCTTGYFFQSKDESRQAAEARDGKTAEFFFGLAEEHDAMVIAGFAEKDGMNVYNAAMIITPDTTRPHIYRKTHLFYKERFCFDEGNTGFSVVQHHKKDCSVGTMICYDWRFPESARVLGIMGADLIACPSNLITNVWHLAMPARALENKVYVAVPNRAGREIRGISANGVPEEVRFTGNSVIYGYNGEVLAQAGASEDAVLVVDIEPQHTRDKSFNPYNDVFSDRRPAFYQPLTLPLQKDQPRIS